MAITYTEDKNFTPQQAAELFLSVRWVVGKYPDRLHKALMNSSRVISAWDGDRLVGLIRVMDDSELVCFINYVLVHPDYHGRGIAGHLLEMVKEIYKSYLYIHVMIGDRFNDQEAAVRKKILFVACEYGYGKSGELDEADARAYSIAELPEIITRLTDY